MKRGIKLSACALIFCILFHFTNKVLSIKLLEQPWDNYYKTIGFFEELEDSLDIIFLEVV